MNIKSTVIKLGPPVAFGAIIAYLWFNSRKTSVVSTDTYVYKDVKPYTPNVSPFYW